MDWDDIRFFLAVARRRGIAGAAEDLAVNQTTVSRRLAAMEERLGARLFDRTSAGHVPTAAGRAVLEHAARMDEEALALERRVLGKDASLSGRLRVTVADAVAIYLLLPRLGEFRAAHPHIDLELVTGDEAFDLSRREADVAVRVTDRASGQLVGRKVAAVRYAVYASRSYLRSHRRRLDGAGIGAVTWANGEARPPWLREGFPRAQVVLRVDSVLSLVAAVRAHLGLALLPCFIGEQERDLERVPTTREEGPWGVWVLSHADLRSTGRVKVFRDFVCGVLAARKDVLG